jgi:glycosyltransferase involved in cell wall biosynthesis
VTANGRRTTEKRALLTVSGVVPPDLLERVATGTRPRADYVELASALDAELLDVEEARRRTGRAGRMVERAAGHAGLLAWSCFRERHRYDVIVTDGEQVGLPLALLCWFTRRRRFGHVMIAHIMSVRKKALPFRLLRLGRHIDTIIVYSSWQRRFVVDELRHPSEGVVLMPFMVDTKFFAPTSVQPSDGDLICTAGLELRDYPTLIEAARDLDVRVVIAAASNWSKRADTTQGRPMPTNVEVCSLDLFALRQLYADAAFVVMPLFDVTFQAGVTTILEAMAMGKAVVCSRTQGQTDVITDDVNGLYVEPGNVGELRSAIATLLADRGRAAELGREARRYAVEQADIDVYVERIAGVVRRVLVRRGVSAR